jgi:DNA-binding NtrC family response regulator
MTILAHVPRGAFRLADSGKTVDQATHVASVGALLDALRSKTWRVTVVSLGAEHVDAAVVTRIAGLRSAGVVLISSPRPTLEAALLAERIGAPAVLSEPFDVADVEALVEAATVSGPVVPLPELQDAVPGLVGESTAMAPVFDLIARVARSTSTVLVTGESGTGKEVVARTLHEQSDRRNAPFVAINCAAIPEHLLESELFGHEKGAFTGAVATRMGRFERADGGTLFLDEIGDMSLLLQAQVLRVLEERRVEPVGGVGEREVDVRLIAATNQHLGEAIEDGRFREDLYYRLAVVEAVLPPLRERAGDVRLLALHFAALFARQHGRPIHGIAEDALGELEARDWPGNVRELRNVIDRAVLLARDGVILRGALRLGSASPHAGARGDGAEEHGYPVTTSLEEVEADHIARVLDSVQGQVGRAARILGVHRNTLSRKIGEYGIGAGQTSEAG